MALRRGLSHRKKTDSEWNAAALITPYSALKCYFQELRLPGQAELSCCRKAVIQIACLPKSEWWSYTKTLIAYYTVC
ncbi:hypothetical protein D770_18020 [Flammeovirgaceae bacterium 311]|nr:hypothetical protein D770_18020 [Flammeovirgaceae bacterium 311]